MPATMIAPMLVALLFPSTCSAVSIVHDSSSSGGGAESVEIAPGVMMPVVNLGGVHERPSNYTLFLELGGKGLDTALTYGDDVQVAVGNAVRAAKSSRKELFVTTKVPCCPLDMETKKGKCNETLKNATESIERDLRLLGLDYVDLMLVHWPCNTHEQTLQTYLALEPMLSKGTARAIGVSNFNTSELQNILQHANVKPAVNQCQMSIGKHDDETIAFCQAHNITYSAWSPLGGLSGIDVLGDEDVKHIAKNHNVSPAQVALRWVAQKKCTLVTAGSKKSYLEEDLDIFSFVLSQDEIELLSRK